MIIPERLAQTLRDEAARRIVRAEAIGILPEDDATLAAWRRADRAHETAYAEVWGIWHAAADLKNCAGYADLLGAPTLRERWAAWRARTGEATREILQPRRLALAGFAVTVIISAAWRILDRPSTPSYRTQIAEIKDLSLEDGSVVTLGAKSALDVRYSADVRRVKLGSGEAFFSVSEDQNRPFVVLVGNTSIRVVGTKFNVNYEDGRVRVSVLEGVVEVMRASGPWERIEAHESTVPKVTLTAGQQAVDTPSLSMPMIQPFPAANPGGWREGRLSYQDAPLSEIIADANRYRADEIRLLAPSLGQERLTTSFKISQIDQMLDQLPMMLPVQVQRNTDGSVNLKPM